MYIRYMYAPQTFPLIVTTKRGPMLQLQSPLSNIREILYFKYMKVLKDNFDIRLWLLPFPFIAGDRCSCKGWT